MLSIEKYWQLIEKIQQFSEQWEDAPPMELNCHPGCSDCCQEQFSLFAVEQAAIRQSLEENGGTHTDSTPDGNGEACPFLKDEMCSIYEVRPIICRTQGYPIVFHDEDGERVSDMCGRHGKDEEVTLPARYVLDLEVLNNCLSSLNFLYLAEMEEQGLVVPARLDILTISEKTPNSDGV